MSSLNEILGAKLSKREQEGLQRNLRARGSFIDFVSNDYLGLARSKELSQLVAKKHLSSGIQNGSSGSRLLAGNSDYAEAVEQKLSSVFKSEASLIFNSGYSANLAVLSSLPQKGDTILYDSLAHASIKDGARLSLATRHAFRHNDLNDLEKKIRHSKGKTYIAVESIYSMDGDESPLKDIIVLARKYDAFVLVDEAHSTGVAGSGGAGMCVHQGIQSKVDVRVYTFGKAMGIHGACVSGSKLLINYLINFARPFIYTTAPSQHTLASIECAFEYLSSNMQLQDMLKQKVQHYLLGAGDLCNRTQSTSAIQTIIIPGNEQIKHAATTLQQKGFDVRPIVYPTVPKQSERLRICLHSFNEDNDITALTDSLHQLA